MAGGPCSPDKHRRQRRRARLRTGRALSGLRSSRSAPVCWPRQVIVGVVRGVRVQGPDVLFHPVMGLTYGNASLGLPRDGARSGSTLDATVVEEGEGPFESGRGEASGQGKVVFVIFVHVGREVTMKRGICPTDGLSEEGNSKRSGNVRRVN